MFVVVVYDYGFSGGLLDVHLGRWNQDTSLVFAFGFTLPHLYLVLLYLV